MAGRRSVPPMCGQGGLDGQMGQQLFALLPVTSISNYASQNVNLSWNCHEKCISEGSEPKRAAVRQSTWVLLHPSLVFGPSVPPHSSFFSSCGTAGLLVSLILFCHNTFFSVDPISEVFRGLSVCFFCRSPLTQCTSHFAGLLLYTNLRQIIKSRVKTTIKKKQVGM